MQPKGKIKNGKGITLSFFMVTTPFPIFSDIRLEKRIKLYLSSECSDERRFDSLLRGGGGGGGCTITKFHCFVTHFTSISSGSETTKGKRLKVYIF